MEIVNEKEVYFFRKYEDVASLVNDCTFNFLDYMHIKNYLMPTIEKSRELKPFLTPNFPLTPPLEYLSLIPILKVALKFESISQKNLLST